MSMAAGEYVSVQLAGRHRGRRTRQGERAELADDPAAEQRELAAHLRQARTGCRRWRDQVAEQLTAHDALGAHARDELGITEALAARAGAGRAGLGASFAVGAALPLLVAALAPRRSLVSVDRRRRRWSSSRCSAPSPRAPAARRIVRRRLRVTFWGALAMAVTAGVGALFGTVV